MVQKIESFIVKSLVGLIGALCLIFAVTISGSAQSDNAQLSGFVKDANGAVLPGAKVVIKNQDKEFGRSAVTSQEGYYVISSLPPGLYTISAEHSGFKRFLLADKKLDPSIAASVDITLETGQVSESVSVTAATSDVQLETATLGKLITREEIERTEVNGRNPIFLALLKPGVSGNNIAQNSFGLTTGGFNINGSRSVNNTIFFDGTVAIRTRSNDTFSVGTADLDATQEVQILTANYNAEYGRSSGGQIRIITKSGAKAFHATAYEYVRNNAFNANSWGRKTATTNRDCKLFPADQQCAPSPFRYNQYGYNVSGPVILPFTHLNRGRRKLFWFWSQEWVKQKTSTLTTLRVPTEKMRQGDFSGLSFERNS